VSEGDAAQRPKKSRARARNVGGRPRPLTAPPPAERIEIILDLMSRDEFVRGETYLELAAKWGLTPSSVMMSTAEASRRMQALVDPAKVKPRLARFLDKTLSKAEDSNDLKARAQVAETTARVLGVMPKEGFNVTINLAESAEWHRVRTAIMTALEPFPEARNAVVAALVAASGDVASVLEADALALPEATT
jgi:hypothetical protein